MKFRMIDQIVAWEANRSIRGVKAVSFEEYSLLKPMDQRERLPESLVLESFCQLASWLVVLSSEFLHMGHMVAVGRADFRGALGPGDRMSMSIRARQSEAEGMLFDGVGQTKRGPVIEVQGLQMARTPLAAYQDADDLRVLFSEIHRPIQGELT